MRIYTRDEILIAILKKLNKGNIVYTNIHFPSLMSEYPKQLFLLDSEEYSKAQEGSDLMFYSPYHYYQEKK